MPNATQAVEDFTLQPRGCMARELRKGQTLRVTDIEGQQVADLIAFALQDLSEKFWISNTIRLNGTIYLTRGHVLYSELSRPMLTITDDTCGIHDLLAGSCNVEIDKVRYGVDDHKGCVENFVSALAPWGIERRDIPMSLNLFMNCPVTTEGGWQIVEPSSAAGDHIDFRTEMDLLVCLSNCPQDLNPCNAGELTPLRVTIS
jgi:urea carboxylase-associated protein 1